MERATMTTRTRMRPQTTSNAQRLARVRAASKVAVSSRRAVRSARARMTSSASDGRPDLNPPQWMPLLCEISPEVTSKPRPDSGYETQDGGARSDDEDDVIVSSKKDNPLSSRFYTPVEDLNAACRSTTESSLPGSSHVRDYSEMPKIPKGRPRTNEQLKEFLSAAMDSVRFFLATSSITQSKRDEAKALDECSDDSDSETPEEPVKEYNRSKLLIMNGALMDPPWRFSMETYREDPEMLEFYTGFRSYELIKSMYQLIKPSADTMVSWHEKDSRENIREGAFKTGIITQLDEFFLFLYKLRHNPSAEDLSVRFSMPATTVQQILDDWLHYMYACYGQDPVWPSRDNVDVFMHTCFRSVCPCARIIIHVTKVKVRLPRYPNHSEKRSMDDGDEQKEHPQETNPDTEQESTENDATSTDAIQDSTQTDTKSTVAESDSTKSDTKSAYTQPESTKSDTKSTYNKPDNTKTDTKSTYAQPDSTKTDSKSKNSAKNSKAPLHKAGTKHRRKKPDEKEKTVQPSERRQGKTKTKTQEEEMYGVQPDTNDMLNYKSVVVFQPSGAACMVSKLYPVSTPSENIIAEMGVLDLLDECDDVVTVDSADDLQHDLLEEMLHPHAANYMNVNFLTGCMPLDELRRKSPMKAHRVRCMRWHIYQSVEWVRHMKIWDELAELPVSWVKHVERVWTVSCLLTNFLPTEPCLEMEAS